MDRPLLSPRGYLTFVIGWLTACVIGFATVFSFRATDDVAGFVIAMAVLQLPAFGGLSTACEGPLSIRRTLAVAIPGSIAAGFIAFMFSGFLAAQVWHQFLDFTAVFVGFGIGVAVLIGTAIVYGFYLRRRPHPAAARRVLWIQAAGGFVAAVIVLAIIRRREIPSAIVVLGTAMLWPVPLLVTCLRRPMDPGPTARVVRENRTRE